MEPSAHLHNSELVVLRQLCIDLSIDFCIELLSLVIVVNFVLPKITVGASHCAEKQAAEKDHNNIELVYWSAGRSWDVCLGN